MVVVAKPLRLFNTVALGLWAIGLGMGAAGSAWAASGDDVPVREAPSPEPVLKLEAPDGHCAYDAAEAEKAGHVTGFEPGLKSGTELMALYVPCASLDAARSGAAEWLP
jgi:hypothetical protein